MTFHNKQDSEGKVGGGHCIPCIASLPCHTIRILMRAAAKAGVGHDMAHLLDGHNGVSDQRDAHTQVPNHQGRALKLDHLHAGRSYTELNALHKRSPPVDCITPRRVNFAQAKTNKHYFPAPPRCIAAPCCTARQSTVKKLGFHDSKPPDAWCCPARAANMRR